MCSARYALSLSISVCSVFGAFKGFVVFPSFPTCGNGSGTGIGNGSCSGSGSGGGGSGALCCERTHSPAVSCGVVACGSLAGGAGAYSGPLSRGVLLVRLCVCGVLALCVFCVLQCVRVCVMCVMCGR